MAFSRIYEFVKQNSPKNDDWIFSGPKGGGLHDKGSRGKWCWADGSTPTKKTGPSKGHTYGYAYIETTRCSTGNVFTIELSKGIDASSGTISLEFWYNNNTRGGAVQLIVSIWDGTKWNKEIDKDIRGKEDVWREELLDLKGYINIDLKVQFKLILKRGGNNSYKDVGLDSIKINSSEIIDETDINAYLISKRYKNVRYGNKRARRNYTGNTISTEDIKLDIQELEQKLKDKELILKEPFLVIQESDSISYLIRPGGK